MNQIMGFRSVFVFVVFAAMWVAGAAGCVGGKLSPGAEKALVVADGAACEVLVSVFAGTTEAGAVCPSEVQLVQGILDSITAPAAVALVGMVLPTAQRHRRIHRRGRPIGYVRAEYAARVQAALDAAG